MTGQALSRLSWTSASHPRLRPCVNADRRALSGTKVRTLGTRVRDLRLFRPLLLTSVPGPGVTVVRPDGYIGFRGPRRPASSPPGSAASMRSAYVAEDGASGPARAPAGSRHLGRTRASSPSASPRPGPIQHEPALLAWAGRIGADGVDHDGERRPVQASISRVGSPSVSTSSTPPAAPGRAGAPPRRAQPRRRGGTRCRHRSTSSPGGRDLWPLSK